MKSTLVIFLLTGTLALASCAKKRTCTCNVNTTKTMNGASETQTSTQAYTTTKAKKNFFQREKYCFSRTSSYDYQMAGETVKVESVYDCTLK